MNLFAPPTDTDIKNRITARIAKQENCKHAWDREGMSRREFLENGEAMSILHKVRHN